MKIENQKDSHKKSLSEALVNSLGGYPVGYGVELLCYRSLWVGFKRIRTWQTLQSL